MLDGRGGAEEESGKEEGVGGMGRPYALIYLLCAQSKSLYRFSTVKGRRPDPKPFRMGPGAVKVLRFFLKGQRADADTMCTEKSHACPP